MSEIHKDLSEAVNLGQLEKVKDLINRYGFYNSGAFGYYNLLRNAVKLKHTEITQLLLISGYEENDKTKIIPSNTPLHFAVLDEDLEVIGMLLDHGANINARNECGCSALLSAIRMAKGVVIDLLFKRGTISPLHVATEQALFSIIEKISMHKSIMNSKTEEHIACMVRDFRLDSSTDAKSCTNNMMSLLYLIVNNCHREAETFLIDYKTKIDAEIENESEKSLLNCSVCKVLSMIFENIVNESSSPAKNNENNKQSAKLVAENGSNKNNVMIFEKLLLYGFLIEFSSLRELSVLKMNYIKQMIPNIMFDHDLDLACCKEENIIVRVVTKNKQVEIFKFLFTHEPEATATDKAEDPAIFYSTENPNESMICCLLLQGAKNNIRFSNSVLKRNCTNLEVDIILENVDCIVKDLTPLQIAVYRGNIKTVKMLLENGVNVNSNRENGDTALHFAAKTCHIDILKILLKNGADVCAKNNQGNTPLHAASMVFDLETVSILLRHGSFVDSKNHCGLTALRIAYVMSRYKKFDLVKLLLHFGADISNCIIHNPSELCYIDITRQSCPNRQKKFVNEETNEEKEQFRFILFHLIMLKTAGLFVKEEHQQFIKFYGCHDLGRTYKKKCEDEIKSLKRRKFPNNKLSFYDILTKNMQYVARYGNCKDFIRIFESEHYKTEFPIYAPILERHLKRAIFYVRAKEFLYLNFKLPYDCSENIFQYLCVTDIERFLFGIGLYQPKTKKIDKILCSKK